MVAWSIFESLTWGSTLKVQKPFVEESNAFSKSENHIGQIESLKLKGNVTNQHGLVQLIVKRQPSCTLKWNNTLKTYWKMSWLRPHNHLLLIPWLVWGKVTKVWDFLWIMEKWIKKSKLTYLNFILCRQIYKIYLLKLSS